MSEERQDQLLQALLDNHIDLEEFKSQIGGMSDEVLQKLRVKLKTYMEEKQTELYHVRRELRGCHRYVDMAEFDKGRVHKASIWLGNQIGTAFNAIFKNPEKAQAKCWAYEQKYGVEKTAKRLKNHPSAFGSLQGFNFFGFKFGGRQLAAAYVSNFDYAVNRTKFDDNRNTLGKIDNNIKRVKE
jgi:hypothetical protein